MLLSEAIREGSKLKGDIPISMRGDFYTRDMKCSCPIASAYDVLVTPLTDYSKVVGLVTAVEHVCPALNNKLNNPVREDNKRTVYSLIMELYDDHKWSKQQIIEWLEGEGL